jgi:hypothetical protein
VILRPSSENCGADAIALGIALNDARRIDCRLSVAGANSALTCVAGRNIGVVVAVSAIGADDLRGVIATIMAATTMTANVPVASAKTRVFEPVSMSTFVGPSSDG